MPIQNTLQSFRNLWDSCTQPSRRRPPQKSYLSADLEHRQLLAAVIANASPAAVAKTSIEGRVFADANKDGQVNGQEQGIGGRGVQLLDANNKVVATVQSKPDGSFRFENMPQGTYSVREVLPPGATSTTPPKPIVIKADSKITGILVGEAPPTSTAKTSIEGRVFTDANKDGKISGTEQGIGGRGIQLLDANNKVVATIKSKPDGSFRFENMPQGTYSVREILPPGATSTTPPKPIVIKADSKITGILVGEAPPTQAQSRTSPDSSPSLTLQGTLLNSLLS